MQSSVVLAAVFSAIVCSAAPMVDPMGPVPYGKEPSGPAGHGPDGNGPVHCDAGLTSVLACCNAQTGKCEQKESTVTGPLCAAGSLAMTCCSSNSQTGLINVNADLLNCVDISAVTNAANGLTANVPVVGSVINH